MTDIQWDKLDADDLVKLFQVAEEKILERGQIAIRAYNDVAKQESIPEKGIPYEVYEIDYDKVIFTFPYADYEETEAISFIWLDPEVGQKVARAAARQKAAENADWQKKCRDQHDARERAEFERLKSKFEGRSDD